MIYAVVLGRLQYWISQAQEKDDGELLQRLLKSGAKQRAKENAKTKRLADKAEVYVDVFKANIQDFRLEREYDILFSSGVFHYIHPELRTEIIENYKHYTSENGLNVFNVFVQKPFIAEAPDKDKSERYHWKSGELFMMFEDWYFENCEERVFDCNSGGIPHKHAMDILLARKIKEI